MPVPMREIMAKYGGRRMIQDEMPPMNRSRMGWYMCTARLKTLRRCRRSSRLFRERKQLKEG